MKKTLVFILACLFSTAMFAQETHWTADNTDAGPLPLTMTCEVYFEGVAQTNTELELGAFAGDICRGVKYPPRVLPNNAVVFQLGCYGAGGETLTFKLYDHSTNKELAMVCEQDGYAYQENGQEGTVRDPYVLNFIPSATTTYDIDITAYVDGDGNNGWNFIASPVSTTPAEVENMLTNTYDLYRFNQSAELQWENYYNHQSSFPITPGTGYLYANSSDVTLKFSGTLYEGNGEFDLDYVENPFDANMKGWNLKGNPFNANATVDREFCVISETSEGCKIMPSTEQTVARMQGIMVQATEPGQTVKFTAETSKGNKASMVMNLSHNQGIVDRAIVRFANGDNMSKFQLFENTSELSIQKDNKDYAVVNTEAQGEVPVSFKAAKNGTYTLSFNTENVEMGYLHLIDNLTGNEVDLLASPSYSFEANTSDYASRFRLVFSTGNANNNFAFVGNGEIFLAGQGDVEVYDVTGRLISSHNDVSHFSAENMSAGVYMIRLTIGSESKTQKIVVK